MKKELLIILPVYNEEAIIGSFINQMKEHKLDELGDILIIDDGSTDRTRSIIKEKQVKVISKPFNLGYGSTLQLGYKYGRSENYQYIIQLDGDGQHDLSNIPVIYDTLVRGKDRPDIVLGSRFLSETSEMKVSPLKKRVISFFSQIIHFFTKQRITDPTSGLQGLNRSAFSYYAEYGNFDYQYPDINMIIQMLLLGYTIREVPARMHNRTTGVSMHSGVIKSMRYMVLISLSTLSILIRKRDRYYQLRRKEIVGELQNE